MIRNFYTADHPEAEGRQPQFGDVAYTFTFVLPGDDYLEVHTGKKARNALLRMLMQEEVDNFPMTSCNVQLPELGVRVLVYDANLKQWRIAQIQQHLSTQSWMIDPKIYHGIDHGRFTHWMPLPEAPSNVSPG